MKKLCKKCNIEKELSLMVKHNLCKDGYLHCCIECSKKRALEIRHPIEKKPKKCDKCGETKNFTEFSKNPRRSCGLNSMCKECLNKNRRDKEYWKTSGSTRKVKRADDSEYRELLQKQKRENSRKNIASEMLARAKKRAIKKNFEFELTKEDITIPEICPILQIPIKIGNKDYYEHSPSIDRIDNTRGYTKDNIQIITKKANSMKNSGTPEELLKLAEWIFKTFKE